MRLGSVPLLVLSVASASGVPAQQEKPTPKLPSARERKLQEAVDEMVAVVEKHAQLRFKARPKVRAATHKEWRETVRAQFGIESGRELFEMSVSTLGLYLAAREEIVLSPLVVAPLIKELDEDASRHKRLAVMHQKATVAHEIVHALQEQHFGLASKLEAADEAAEILRYKWLLEGHAVFVEARIAERELGIEDFMLTGPYGGITPGADPSYVRGWRYFTHVFRKEGMKGVFARLKQPPTFDEIKELAKQPLPPEPAPPEGPKPKPKQEPAPGRGAGAGKRRT